MEQKTEDKLKRILWLDLETTGIRHDVDRILEVAWRITDVELNDWGSQSVWAVVNDEPALELMSDFVREMHTKNGLIDEVKSLRAMHLHNVEDEILAMMDRVEADFDPELTKFEWVIGGTGVATFDLPMLAIHMPRLRARLAYYTFDVGVFRRFLRDSFGIEVTEEFKTDIHRAAGDVDMALAEARFYQTLVRSGAAAEVRVTELTEAAAKYAESAAYWKGRFEAIVDKVEEDRIPFEAVVENIFMPDETTPETPA